MKITRKTGIAAFFAALICIAFIGAAKNSDIYFLIKKNFTIFSDVYREVSLNYVDEVNPEKLMRKGINAMLESLDPYTVFIDEAQNQDIEIITRGSYGGVGLEVDVRGNNIVVIAPREGYPAYHKGIRSGDIIKAVDGISVEKLSPEEVQSLTIGEPGTKVTITIERYGVPQDLTFELTRELVEVKNIAYHGLIGTGQDIGYILLTRFSQNAAEEIRKALDSLQAQTKLKGLILDLRNNPGGLLEEAVKTVDKFVGPGLMVVETRGRLNDHNSIFRTEEPALLGELPLAVLQNNGSASASEIVSGALQDLDRAVIIGEQSFGKGLVQIVRPLSYNTALKITTSQYFIPSGRSIQSVTYTHDEQNSQISKPDSLRRAFKTRNGRTVYDGYGITPDISVPEPSPTLLETSLYQQSYFFNFANRYASLHETLNIDEISDELFSQFRSYLEEQNFEYRTQTEHYLAQVEAELGEDSRHQNSIKTHISALEQVTDLKKEQEFNRQKERLKQLLYKELVSRYKGTKGQIAASIKFDPVVKEALSVLDSLPRYHDILGN